MKPETLRSVIEDLEALAEQEAYHTVYDSKNLKNRRLSREKRVRTNKHSVTYREEDTVKPLYHTNFTRDYKTSMACEQPVQTTSLTITPKTDDARKIALHQSQPIPRQARDSNQTRLFQAQVNKHVVLEKLDIDKGWYASNINLDDKSLKNTTDDLNRVQSELTRSILNPPF